MIATWLRDAYGPSTVISVLFSERAQTAPAERAQELVSEGLNVVTRATGRAASADTGRYDFYDRLKSIRKRRPVFYCLNGTFYRDIDLHAQAATMREFLEERYPFPSPYEAAEPRHRRPDHA